MTKPTLHCPTHGTELRKSKGFKPREGLDPKMTKHTCIDCALTYYYYAPRYARLLTTEEVQQMGLAI